SGTQTAANVPLMISRISDDFGTPADAADDFEPVYVSGDTNGDGFLDVGETWIYTSQGVVDYSVVPGPYTNTVVVEAFEQNGGTTADTAENRHVGSEVGITIKKAINAVN